MFAEEKEYRIGDEVVRVQPLSFYDATIKVPGIMARIMEHGEDLDQLTNMAVEELLLLLSHVTGRDLDFWKSVPVAIGLTIMNDFLEGNLNENFFAEAPRLVTMIKRIGTLLPPLS